MIFRFVLFYLALSTYIIWRGIWPAFSGLKARLFASFFVALAPFCGLVTLYCGGSLVAPVLPAIVIEATDFIEGTVVLLAGIFILRDLIWIALLGIRKCCKTTPGALWRLVRVQNVQSFVCVTIVALSVATIAQVTGLSEPIVKEVTVPVKGLPAELNGMTIAQLTDLHVSSLFRAEIVRDIVKKTNDLNPDMIVVTGDFVDGEVADRAADLKPLMGLTAPMGVWGVEGNHEHYVDYNGWRAFFSTLNIGMLYNTHAVLTRNGAPLVVAGLTDPMAERYGRELPNLSAALKGAPKATTILLSHQPKHARFYASRADVMLSGHTHGGQTYLLGLIVKFQNDGFLKGLYDVESEGKTMKLYVSPGTLLWNGFAMRLGTRGEITLLKLVPQ